MEEGKSTRLIIRYLSREATIEEEEALLEWISEDIAHQKIFNDWVELWNNKPEADRSFDLTKGLSKLNETIDASEMKIGHRFWRKMAATILLLLTTGAILLFISKFSVDQSGIVSYSQKETHAGQKLKLKLSDGSVVSLNANSTFKYPDKFTGERREVFLEGEAFFEVAKDSVHPFIIHANSVDTRVLGTSFNVNTKTDSTIVSVVTGKVQVSLNELSEIVMPNEKVVYTFSKKRLAKARANLELELAWRSNTIILRDSKLLDAAEKLREVYGYYFFFEKENLKTCPITGKFTNQPLEAILKAISFSTNATYRIEGRNVIFYGQGCGN
jgi:transmembrane sensor